MKIRSIRIQGYKNVPDEMIYFNTDLTSLIIGQNGLGKSNLLEALSLIFVAISNTSVETNLANFDNKYFSFKISYTLRKNEIEILYGIDGKYSVKINDDEYIIRTPTDDGSEFKSRVFNKIQGTILPDYFVTYYSGQNKRLEKILESFESNYIKGLKENKNNDVLTKQRRFMYLKNFHSPLLILVLTIFKDYQDKAGKYLYKDKLIKLFEYLRIKPIEKFSLVLTSPEWIGKSYNERLSDEDKSRLGYLTYIHTTQDENLKNPGTYPNPFWQFKSSLNNLMECLIKSFDIVPIDNSDTRVKGEAFQEYISFNEVHIDSFKNVIFEYFKTPLELFYSLEALVLLGCLDVENDLKFEIIKNESISSDKKLTYESLSEGENQLFIILGNVLITGCDETLYLLDEPDTYLNPKWQREYIHLLEEFNLEDDDSHIIVTTHSPLLVQNIEGQEDYKYDLFLLCRNEDGSIQIDQGSRIIDNWRIDQVLASKYFDLISTRPINFDNFIAQRNEIINKGKLSEEDLDKLKKLENEYGYLPTGETIIELKSIAYLNTLR